MSLRSPRYPSTRLCGLAGGLLGGLGGLFLAAGTPLAVIALGTACRRTLLVRTGTPTLGVVDGVVENDAPLRFKGSYRLTYRFTDYNDEDFNLGGANVNSDLQTNTIRGGIGLKF